MDDAFVQVAPDGTGKKVATQEFTRDTGDIVEAQQVLSSDPVTGRPLDAPPWDELLQFQRMILIELRVLVTLLSDETRSPTRQVDELRAYHEEQLT